MVLLHGKGIYRQPTDVFLRLLPHEFQGILEYQEVKLIGIMMGSRKRDGVELPVAILHHRRMLLMRVMAMVAAAEHQEDAQQQNLPYRRFSLQHNFLA